MYPKLRHIVVADLDLARVEAGPKWHVELPSTDRQIGSLHLPYCLCAACYRAIVEIKGFTPDIIMERIGAGRRFWAVC